jgi:hypothetical protein
MQQRGRKSAASLSVVAGTIDGRPKPPSDLTKEQAEIWNRVVASEAVDVFKTATVQRLLADYCRHSVAVEKLTKIVDGAMNDPQAEISLEDLDRLLKMRERETRACLSIATKLRLTNQSRYQPSTAAVKAANVTERKLWQRA